MADIQLDDITNATSTGVFDKLMEAVSKEIESQYLNNRITGSDYANVYLGGMQAVLQQSMQYVLQEQLTEAQIEGVLADNLLKAKQLEIAEQELLAKSYEVSTLLVDQHNTNLAQQELLATEEEAKQYEVDNLLPEQLTKLQEEIDLLQTQDLLQNEQIKVAYADRVTKDKQAAKLGLDNVMKTSEASKDLDSNFVYSPRYEDNV
jgi:hypothetical protein